MTEMTRRNLLRFGLGAAGTVVLLRGGGRALAGPASAAPRPVPGQGGNLAISAACSRTCPRCARTPARTLGHLAHLADAMLEPGGGVDTTHGALYTYFGQFVDHDITLDLTPQPRPISSSSPRETRRAARPRRQPCTTTSRRS